MKFPIFASFIVFTIWLTFEIKRNSIKQKKAQDKFWEIEAAANSTRKKPLTHLDYIDVPLDQLPMNLLTDDETIQSIHKTIRILSEKKIVNFTGYTNTELKLEYGAPNITALTEYDQNFTLLVRTLQTWAELLFRENYIEEARFILEYAISIRSDVSKSYKLLADIYFSQGEFDKIRELSNTASTLNSVMKNVIVRMLRESYLYSD